MTDEREPSGSHHVVERTGDRWSIDARAIGMGLLFLLGGGAGGFGTTVLGGSGVKDELAGLRVSVEAMRNDLVGLKAEGKHADDNRLEVMRRLEDHDKRIRDLERGQ